MMKNLNLLFHSVAEEDKIEKHQKIADLQKKFFDMLRILLRGDEDKININERVDEIKKQLDAFKIQKPGNLEGILPDIYEDKRFTKPDFQIKIESELGEKLVENE